MAEQAFPDIWTKAHRVHDAGLLGYTIELTCPVCRHVHGFNPYALWWLFERRGWDDLMSAVPERFHCVTCRIADSHKVRPMVRVTDDKPTDETLQRPDGRTWAKSVKRRRT